MASSRKKLLIIDGYNVLRSGSLYKPVSREHPDYTDAVSYTHLDVYKRQVVGWYGSFPILGRNRKPSHGARFCLSVLIFPVATAWECYQGEAGVFKISFS